MEVIAVGVELFRELISFKDESRVLDFEEETKGVVKLAEKFIFLGELGDRAFDKSFGPLHIVKGLIGGIDQFFILKWL